MVQIGMLVLLVNNEKKLSDISLGIDRINHIVQNYININSRWPYLGAYDFVEFIDKKGKPYKINGCILSDPGHSIEFVGLCLKFTRIAKKSNTLSKAQIQAISEIEKLMPETLIANFDNGFRDVGGLCKTFDLLTRCPVNTHMPWWSLPETIRAALESFMVSDDEHIKKQCLHIAAKSHNAFMKYYVRPELNMMAVQARDKDGNAVDVIPAVPDADPGYHTGICLIDSLMILKKISEKNKA